MLLRRLGYLYDALLNNKIQRRRRAYINGWRFTPLCQRRRTIDADCVHICTCFCVIAGKIGQEAPTPFPTPGWRRVHFIRVDRTWGGKLVPRRQKGFHLLPNVLAWKFMAAASYMCAFAVTAAVCDGSNTLQKEHICTRALSLSSPGEGRSSLQLLPSRMENAHETFIYTTRCWRDHVYCSTESFPHEIAFVSASRK